jgi:predicted nuclease of restriction endonuclease-like (RecB) superfamily
MNPDLTPPSVTSQPNTDLLVELCEIIHRGKSQAVAAVNSALTLTFWHVGKRINDEVLQGERAAYGKQVIPALAKELVAQYGKSFEARNLHRMMQFAEMFPDVGIVKPLASQLSWTHFAILLTQPNDAARQFYAHQSIDHLWSKRELTRQIERKAFERSAIADHKRELAAAPELSGAFKDPYFFDFLGLPDSYLDLDLLFYHRRLKRLVAVELKIDRFKAAPKALLEKKLRTALIEIQSRLAERKQLDQAHEAV